MPPAIALPDYVLRTILEAWDACHPDNRPAFLKALRGVERVLRTSHQPDDTNG